MLLYPLEGRETAWTRMQVRRAQQQATLQSEEGATLSKRLAAKEDRLERLEKELEGKRINTIE